MPKFDKIDEPERLTYAPKDSIVFADNDKLDIGISKALTDYDKIYDSNRQVGTWRDWAPQFLRTLAQTGNVRLSFQAAGVARTVVYDARRDHPEFKALWDEARENAIDILEAVARKRAMESSDALLMFLLKSYRRDVFGDKVRVDHAMVRDSVQRFAERTGVDYRELLLIAEEIAGNIVEHESVYNESD